MNEGDVSKQIQQMVRFIRMEAQEKANEITLAAEEVHFISFPHTATKRKTLIECV